MTSQELRQSFLQFFKDKEHDIVPSAPVVPQDDPTLLFTNAGMNQFKDIFLGIRAPKSQRIADSQKCIRVSGKHNDLEEVGRDTYHHTFFEMLGNWSFGDYFKKEAIKWAWELLTDVWKLPKDKLYATIFEGDPQDNVERDDEAGDFWKSETDIDPSHILAFGKKDNFWEMGDTGPCGPCSEVHIDRGPEFCDNDAEDHVCQVNGDCARYIELWNLVFIQYNRDESGKLHLLPSKHVDTGAGFERLVAVMQKKSSNYDTDIFVPIIQQLESLSGRSYGSGEEGVAFRVIADHIRALAFAIADGAIPGNEGRGYVLRRILRRAARFGRILDMHEPFIYQLLDSLEKVMGDAYPEIRQRKEYIARVIRAEEESFGRTLDRGIEIFEQKASKILQSGGSVFPGTDAFLLHDTYGFPLDLTQLMAEEKNLVVDIAAFETEMEKQRERSTRGQSAAYQTIDVEGISRATEFVGYEQDATNAVVVQAIKDKIILDHTPFYAESGGQVGDKGTIKNDSFEFRVTDTKNIGEHIVHFGELVSGEMPKKGDEVHAAVDASLRRATERNHTVTHLVHKALRDELGDHVHQAGSLVGPDYMRFDFTHFERVSEEQLRRIERVVNEKIVENRRTTWRTLSLDEAKAQGAMALFGEKYGDTVRMVEVDGYSRELCGGTHVRATGEIGDFVIINETSVAAGIRRIECLTGLRAHDYLVARKKELETAAQTLSCNPEEVTERIQTLLEERKKLDLEMRELKRSQSKNIIAELLTDVKKVDDVSVVAAQVDVSSVDELRAMGDQLRNGLGSGVGILGSVIGEKVSLVCIVTKDLIKSRDLRAGDIVKKIAAFANGGGGGSPHMALAGAKDISKLPHALAQTEAVISELLGTKSN